MHTPRVVCVKSSGVIHRSSLRPRWEFPVALFALLFSVYGVPILAVSSFFIVSAQDAARYVASSLLTMVAVLVLKSSIGRERPHPGALGSRRFSLRHMEENCSMPSGDSAQAAVGAYALWSFTGSWVFVYTLPVVMYARVYYGFHWVSDTVVGACIGAVVTHFVIAFTTL